MASSTWDSTAVPILEEIGRAERQGAMASFELLVDATGIDKATTERELRVLIDGRYVTGIDASSLDGFDYIELRLLERGKRVVGEWPGDEAFRVLVELVDRRIDDEPDPQRRRGLQMLKDGLTAIGTGAGGNLLADVLRAIG